MPIRSEGYFAALSNERRRRKNIISTAHTRESYNFLLEAIGLAFLRCGAKVRSKLEDEMTDLVLAKLQKEPIFLTAISAKFQLKHSEIVAQILSKSPIFLMLISEKFKFAHPELVMDIAKRKPSVLKYVPDAIKIEYQETVFSIIKESSASLNTLPIEMQFDFFLRFVLESRDKVIRFCSSLSRSQSQHLDIVIDMEGLMRFAPFAVRRLFTCSKILNNPKLVIDHSQVSIYPMTQLIILQSSLDQAHAVMRLNLLTPPESWQERVAQQDETKAGNLSNQQLHR